jgi:hypothetical protein
LDSITGEGRELEVESIASPNLAFGRIDITPLFRRWSG